MIHESSQLQLVAPKTKLVVLLLIFYAFLSKEKKKQKVVVLELDVCLKKKIWYKKEKKICDESLSDGLATQTREEEEKEEEPLFVLYIILSSRTKSVCF